jgi:hypothetical protein
MWDDARQLRLQELQEVEQQGGLSESDREEFAALVAERCRHEEAALREATTQAAEENSRLEEKLQRIQSQNHQLEALVQEQEEYLAEVESLIRQMEVRRREWHERYRRLTGEPLGGRTGAKPGP